MILDIIRKECSEFLNNCKFPLLKNLSIKNEDIKKVKVRHKEKSQLCAEAFNRSFGEKKLFERSVFAYGENIFKKDFNHEFEPFYIFPINGYKFVYNPVITNAFEDYNKASQILLKIIKEDSIITKILSDTIKENYISDNINKGIKNGSEIIIYNIPYYYAIRKSLVDSYRKI